MPYVTQRGTLWRIVLNDPATEKRAWQIFMRCQDKEFSFTDCTSFAAMERESTRTAWTFNTHFREHGFEMAP